VETWHLHMATRMSACRGLVLCMPWLYAVADAAAARPLRLGRRAALGLATAGATSAAAPAAELPVLDGYKPDAAVTRASAGRRYFPPLTPPRFVSATYRDELGRGAWALEQLLTFANVSATVRTIVVKLKDGTLWVNGPQWPTGEFCALLDELGPVGHVVLPCVALEHKAPLKAFTKRYPSASVWIAPGQYGPFGECGRQAASARMGYRVDGVFPIGAPKPTDPKPPWADEIDTRTLYVDLPENAGPVAETAFLHRPTSTLITSDSVVFVPEAPPPIFSTYFSAPQVADPDFWAKSVIQAVFLPLRENGGADRRIPTERWPGYGAVQGRLLRAPILRAFADSRAPDEVREWVTSISSDWDFDRVLTAHFASPVKATPQEYAAAFTYLDRPLPDIECQDWKLLDGLNDLIETNKLGAPVKAGFDFKAGCKGSS